MKFYSVTQFEHNEYCRHHGYFVNLENAFTMALKAVANVQDEILIMREHCQNEEISFEDYKNDMTRLEKTSNPRNIAEWEGNYNSVSIYVEETED